jgi:hypothetical protein
MTVYELRNVLNAMIEDGDGPLEVVTSADDQLKPIDTDPTLVISTVDGTNVIVIGEL